MSAAKRLGPNPYLVEVSRHIPRIGIWGASLFVFLTWPMLGKVLNKKGIYNV